MKMCRDMKFFIVEINVNQTFCVTKLNTMELK